MIPIDCTTGLECIAEGDAAPSPSSELRNPDASTNGICQLPAKSSSPLSAPALGVLAGNGDLCSGGLGQNDVRCASSLSCLTTSNFSASELSSGGTSSFSQVKSVVLTNTNSSTTLPYVGFCSPESVTPDPTAAEGAIGAPCSFGGNIRPQNCNDGLKCLVVASSRGNPDVAYSGKCSNMTLQATAVSPPEADVSGVSPPPPQSLNGGSESWSPPAAGSKMGKAAPRHLPQFASCLVSAIALITVVL